MKLRLSWTDPASQRLRQPILDAPIALGQSFEAMPQKISDKSVSRMVISDRQADGFQALLVEIEGQVYLIDNGGKTHINQHRVEGQARLNSGDRIHIGQTELQFQILEDAQQPADQQTTHLQSLPESTSDQLPEIFVQNDQPGPSHHSPLPSPTQSPTPLPQQYPIQAPQLAAYQQPLPTSQSVSAPQSADQQQPIQPPQSGQTRQPIQHQQPVQHQQPPPAPKTENVKAVSNGHQPAQNRTIQPPHSPSHPVTQIPKPAAMPMPKAPATEGRPSSGCRRIVGFLFKRPCGRSSSTGCTYCANGGYSSQAFSADYKLYEGFGRYELGDWGYGLLASNSNSETE